MEEIIDKMYYYNPKYPEHGIGELPLVDIAWIKSVVNGENLSIHGVISRYNIETEKTEEFAIPYYLYSPWENEEDNDMYMVDLSGNRHRVLSFNKEKLEEWWKSEVDIAIKSTKRKLEELEECINQK